MASSSGLRTFDSAVAVVTGGASGIGRALAEELARRGAAVVLGDLQNELVNDVAAGIRSRGGTARAEETDVAEFPAVERLVRGTVDRHGRLDYLFNNAGIGIVGGVDRYRLEDWHRMLDVNVRGVAHGVHAAYPVMCEQGFGHIVNTASMAGLTATPMTAGYTATKHAVIGLSSALRIEAAGRGVRVSALCPGVIRTPILEGGRYGRILPDISPDFLRGFVERLKPTDAGRFAERALRRVAANQAIIIVPGRWRLIWWLHRLSPALTGFLNRKVHEWAMAKMKAS